MKPKVLFTDGEGPLILNDLAAEVTDRVAPGLFNSLSIYTTYLVEKKREGIQAGDTLALVVPFLLAHGVTREDIVREAEKSTLCPGVKEYVSGLKNDGWDVRVISTAYSQLWEFAGPRIGIPMEDIACTQLDLESLGDRFDSEEFHDAVKDAELFVLPLGKRAAEEVAGGRSVVEIFEDPEFQPLRDRLDAFYGQQLPEMGFWVLDETRPIGGERKVEAAVGFARDLNVKLSDIAYVGDSITDKAMLERLSREGGLPIAVNANRYALDGAEVGVATENMQALRPVLDTWHRYGFDGINGVRGMIERSKISLNGSREGAPRYEGGTGVRYDILNLSDTHHAEGLIAAHSASREAVRGSAAELI